MESKANLKPVPTYWPEGERLPIAIVGEAPGSTEALEGKPFVGASGQLLTRMLKRAGIDRTQCLITNVFDSRPFENNVGEFFVRKNQWDKEWGDPRYPAFQSHGYLHPKHYGQIERLCSELLEYKPNLIIATGATPLWALLEVNGISDYRGTVQLSRVGIKMIATYHPAAVLRNYPLYPVASMDIMKASYEAAYPDYIIPQRTINIVETLTDMRLFYQDMLQAYSPVAVDIETTDRKEVKFYSEAGIEDPYCIKCIAFSRSPHESFVIPLNNKAWTYEEEVEVWDILNKVLRNPAIEKLFQNGMFDMEYLARCGFEIRGNVEDTMHLHHALQPELPKDLGTLGSLYTNEVSWKLLGRGGEMKFDN